MTNRKNDFHRAIIYCIILIILIVLSALCSCTHKLSAKQSKVDQCKTYQDVDNKTYKLK